MTTNGYHPTTVAAWTGPQTKVVTLPSGNVARLRDKLPVYMLLRTGQFSEELFEAFGDWQRGELTDPQRAAELLDLIVCSMFVEPTVTLDGADGTLSVEQLAEDDVDFVLAGATGGAPDPGFRGDEPGVGHRDDSADVERDAVEPAGSRAGDAGGAKRRPPARRKSTTS